MAGWNRRRFGRVTRADPHREAIDVRRSDFDARIRQRSDRCGRRRCHDGLREPAVSDIAERHQGQRAGEIGTGVHQAGGGEHRLDALGPGDLHELLAAPDQRQAHAELFAETLERGGADARGGRSADGLVQGGLELLRCFSHRLCP